MDINEYTVRFYNKTKKKELLVREGVELAGNIVAGSFIHHVDDELICGHDTNYGEIFKVVSVMHTHQEVILDVISKVW